MNRPAIRSHSVLFGLSLCFAQLLAGCGGDPAEAPVGAGGGIAAGTGGGVAAGSGTVKSTVLPGGGGGGKLTGGTTPLGGGGATGKGSVVVSGGSATKPGTGGTTSKTTSGVVPTGGTTSKTTAATTAKGGSTSTGPTIPPIPAGQGKEAKITRYWDCAKPSCAWPGKVSGGNPVKTCGKDGTSTVGADTASGADGGGAYQCYWGAPWAVGDKLAYGFVATHTDGLCGKCFQLDFIAKADLGPASSLVGKSMIVQAVNIGGDVTGEQFDLLLPGGGIGLVNACTPDPGKSTSPQWPSISKEAMGELYGGFLSTCGRRQSCTFDMCTKNFGDKGPLLDGCKWLFTWLNGVDNPRAISKEITCPPELKAKSGT